MRLLAVVFGTKIIDCFFTLPVLSSSWNLALSIRLGGLFKVLFAARSPRTENIILARRTLTRIMMREADVASKSEGGVVEM